MLRRALWVSLAGIGVLPKAVARPKLGDAEWLRRFGVFLRALNLFVLALNEDRLDRAGWARVQSAWAELDLKGLSDARSDGVR
ncbi:MAG TPA: hypothetical protein VES20_25460 [Bryobacteraceae bacterium]|nr:hypothetical protein [Bryobacteraceae bacterium]